MTLSAPDEHPTDAKTHDPVAEMADREGDPVTLALQPQGTLAPLSEAPLHIRPEFLPHQPAMRTRGIGNRRVRSQFGALPWRVHEGKLEILIITSRGTGRWILPKGWPMLRATPAEAAATEAWEEAGVVGRVSATPAGFYSYRKKSEKDAPPVVVAIFPIQVTEVHAKWPEEGQRKRRWVSQKKATALIDDQELKEILKHFDPTLY